jgi:DNA-binding Lrp family transcriptional regulator
MDNMNFLRLTAVEGKILACTLINADLDATKIAALLKVRTHIVHYALNKFHDSGVCSYLPLIDLHRLGLELYAVYFSPVVSGDSDQSVKKLIGRFISHPQVSFVSEYAGGYRYGVGIIAGSAHEAHVHLATIVGSSGSTLLRKSIAIRTNLYELPRRYLWSSPALEPLHFYGNPGKRSELTALDHTILSHLTTAPFTTYREASRQLRIANSTLDARLRVLRREGVLRGAVHSLNAQLIGRHTYKLLIYARGLDLHFTRELRKTLWSCIEAVHFVECLGEWDFEVNIEVASDEQVTQLVDQLFSKFSQNITDIVPLGVVKTHKRWSIPAKADNKR